MGSSGSGGRSWPAGRQGRGGGADLERAVVLLFLDVEQVQRPVTVDHAQQKPVVVREREVVLQVEVRAAVDQEHGARLRPHAAFRGGRAPMRRCRTGTELATRRPPTQQWTVHAPRAGFPAAP